MEETLHQDLFSHETITTNSIAETTQRIVPSHSTTKKREETQETPPNNNDNTLVLTLAPLHEPIPKEDEHGTAATIENLRLKQSLICNYMGTMAQCRGENGNRLREAGAIGGVLYVLHCLVQEYIPHPPLPVRHDDVIASPLTATEVELESEEPILVWNDVQLDKKDHVVSSIVLEVASTCLAALRDLACGSMTNRSVIGETHHTTIQKEAKTTHSFTSGIEILAFFIHRLHKVSWERILVLPVAPVRPSDNDWEVALAQPPPQPPPQHRLELRLLTNAIGVLRNVAHSHRINCELIHKYGITTELIWRLKLGTTSKESSSILSRVDSESTKPLCPLTNTTTNTTTMMPDASKPWREASYRIAGCLVNLAEKCHEVASLCARDDELIQILIDSWGGGGGKNSSLLHIGLGNILKERQETGDAFLDELVLNILEKEGQRADDAREKEKRKKNKT